MTPYETYCCHIALRTHFKDPKYDYFKHEGKLKGTVTGYRNFDKKSLYQRLSKHRDPGSVILANILDGKGETIVDITGSAGIARYESWLARTEAGSYGFAQELEKIDFPFCQQIKVIDGQHPPILTRHAKGKFSLESLIVINDLTECFLRWNAELVDPIYWPRLYVKCQKYRPFLNLNIPKYRQVLLDTYQEKC